MKHRGSIAASILAILFFLFGAILFSPEAHAVVGDVTLTGLPPNTTVTLTNDATREKTEGKSDNRGGLFIPLGGKNWQAGSYTVTARTASRTIQLRDGINTVNLSGLVAGGYVPGLSHRLEFNVTARFFDGTLPLDPSAAIRVLYTPPIVCCQETFSLSPYGSAWSIPSANIRGHKPFDHGGQFQDKIDSGTIWGFNAGLMHESNLEKWGISTSSAEILGILMFGIGYVRYDFDMKRLAQPENLFQEARGFNSTDNALRFEVNGGVAARWGSCSCSLGIRGGAAPTRTNIFNGGDRWRTEGNLGLYGAFTF